MEVNYLDKELFVDTMISDETEYPVLQMDWIEGETMESFISTHHRDTLSIRNLYERFCDLALWLRTKPFAHGDIKPDNIMIKNDGSLVLIDYDGMFVPDFAGKKSPTTGTQAFSHPLRTAYDFNKDIDDFALEACQYHYWLCQKILLYSKHTEHLIGYCSLLTIIMISKIPMFLRNFRNLVDYSRNY